MGFENERLSVDRPLGWMEPGQDADRAWTVGTVELTRAGSGARVGVGDCAGTEVDVDEEMNEELTIDPERALQASPVVYFGKASRAAASFNHAVQLLVSSPTLEPAVSSHKV